MKFLETRTLRIWVPGEARGSSIELPPANAANNGKKSTKRAASFRILVRAKKIRQNESL